MNVIVDSSSLIVLARQDALWLLERIFGAAALTPDVENETVVQGKAKGYADAHRIEAALAAGSWRCTAIIPRFAPGLVAHSTPS